MPIFVGREISVDVLVVFDLRFLGKLGMTCNQRAVSEVMDMNCPGALARG
jgi:hypothetical protein